MELPKIIFALRGQAKGSARAAAGRAVLKVLESGPGAGGNFASGFRKNLARGQVVLEDHSWLEAGPSAEKPVEELLSLSRESGAELLLYARAEARKVFENREFRHFLFSPYSLQN
ncbi:MAG: hypothetical protein UY87_C0070G0009 [Candidatus Peribacteria bacterium GW2011_GWC2_54_8]|nr:MAG: hypothetical protein UY87_C0070G0009 [Candidatus Peribacteria bacterium GW2011_GWC2_54_8]